MTEEQKKADENAESAKGSGAKGLLLLVSGIVVCLGSAAVVGFFAFPDTHAEVHDEKPKEEVLTVLVPVPKVLVNLAESNGHRLLQATLSLELETTKSANDAESIEDLLPRVQDALIKVLSSFKESDLDGGSAKEFAQTRIRDHLNGTLFHETSRRVIGVYFTEFVIQ